MSKPVPPPNDHANIVALLDAMNKLMAKMDAVVSVIVPQSEQAQMEKLTKDLKSSDSALKKAEGQAGPASVETTPPKNQP